MSVPNTEIPQKYEPESLEGRWRKEWEDNGVYAWDPAKGRDETFVVDTPPPTVSGSLHVGHLFSYSHQDFIVRFQRMSGKNIFFPIGWDDNGLPTERRVQNLYNVKCEPHLHYDPEFKGERGRKGDPLPISRRNFIELCQVVTREDEEAFRHLWSRLGLSYDWDQEYATIDEHCRRISQLSFLELLENGEVYQAERPVMWDVDFRTAIAQAEVEDRERPSAFHFLRFGVEGSEEKIVIATTRPELLAACVAVLVHPEDDRYTHLVGKNAVTPLFHAPVPIMADPKADPEKGTGIVMVCTFGDQTDMEWVREYSLPIRQVLDRDGHLLPVRFGAPGSDHLFVSLNLDAANEVYGQVQGLYVKQAQKRIVEIANTTDGVIDRPSQDITHAVKFFEKGDRPLELIPARQWFTRILDHKEALVGQGRKIQWHPKHMGIRYEHWVEGLNQDWCMSRQRFFGVPIPVWYKIDADGRVLYDERIVPGAESLPIDPLDDVPPGYTQEQRDEPNGFTGDPDVFDTWATSSLTPQIATHWLLNGERHGKLFPMDVRPQSHEIIRTWAFYTIVKAYLHENEIPWRNVVISGWILDPDRKKMSKSQGNVVTPEPLIDQFGADAVRYWAARARLGVDTAYDEQVFKVGKRLCTKLFNASKFAIGRFEGIDPALLGPERVVTETDRAVIQELRPMIERATAVFEQFDYAQALSLIEDFFWRTFCDNFLELAKPRTYDEELTEGRLSAASALRLAHRALVRMLAPFLPYLAEEVWHWCYSADEGMHSSVHRSPWPSLSEFESIPAPVTMETYDATIAVIDAVRKAKAESNLSMKAPVKGVAIEGSADVLRAIETTRDDVMRMLHIETFDAQEGKVELGLVEVSVTL
ncbi:MAG: valine--tRNA ligase [Candidatus Hydrogenedentota bacterium]